LDNVLFKFYSLNFTGLLFTTMVLTVNVMFAFFVNIRDACIDITHILHFLGGH